MISEDHIEKALDWMRDNCDAAAQARAERVYVEEYRKTLKAEIMREHPSLAVAAQEREAYADKRYIAHLGAIRDAVYTDEKNRFLRAAAEAKINAWQTQSANHRTMEKIR